MAARITTWQVRPPAPATEVCDKRQLQSTLFCYAAKGSAAPKILKAPAQTPYSLAAPGCFLSSAARLAGVMRMSGITTIAMGLVTNFTPDSTTHPRHEVRARDTARRSGGFFFISYSVKRCRQELARSWRHSPDHADEVLEGHGGSWSHNRLRRGRHVNQRSRTI